MFYAETTDWTSEDPAGWLSFSLDLRFIVLLTSSSFLSTNCISSLKLPRRDGLRCLSAASAAAAAASASAALGSPAASELEYLLYCQQTRMKNTSRAKRHIRAHTRKRPQKLPRPSLVAPTSLSSEEQLDRVNHSSWILWSWPLSESWRMAVDKSAARGESLWNACKEEQWRWINYFHYNIRHGLITLWDATGGMAKRRWIEHTKIRKRMMNVQSPIPPSWTPVPLLWNCSDMTRKCQHMASHQQLQQHRHLLVHV